MEILSGGKSPTDEPPPRPAQTLQSAEPAPAPSEPQPSESRVPTDTVGDGISTQTAPAPSEPQPSESGVPPDTVDDDGISTQPAQAPSEPQPSESRIPPDTVGRGISTPESDLPLETLPEAEPTSEMSVPCDDQVTGVGLPAGEPPGVNLFAVGDLVWGKAKSHHWCPAMVSDPSTALDPAKKTHRSLLVRFFGSGAFSWCEPAQLKPFMEEFHEMVWDRSSKSFLGAVEDALDLISWRRQSELTCSCLPSEAQRKHTGAPDGRLAVANFQPSEFLEHLGDLACDVTAIDVLQLQDLKGWAMAFGKGWRDGSPGYHPGRETLELVDKFDLDVPPGDLGDASEEGDVECSIIGKGSKASKGSLHNIQRKRSMAALIAGMDVDTVEFSDGNGVKKKLKPRKQKGKFEGDEVNDMDAGFGEAQEETFSGRRERKKSKYLSPPYTSLAAGIKSLDSKGTAVVKSPRKNAEAEPALNSHFSALSSCSFEAELDEDTGSPVVSMDGVSMYDILSEFFSTSRNSLHLQGNRLETMIRSFFSKYRSSMYSSGTDFLTYQKNQNGSGDKNAGFLEEVTLNNSSEVGTSTGKQEDVNDAVNLEIKTGFSADAMSNSKSDKAGKKRKMCNGELSVSSQKGKSGGKKKIKLLERPQETKSGQTEKSQVSKPSQVGKSRKKKSKPPEPSQDSDSKQKESNLSQPSLEGKSEHEESKLSQPSHEGKPELNEEGKLSQPSHEGTPELNEEGKLSQPYVKKASELLVPSQEGKSAQKKKSKLSDPSQGGKSGEKKKKKKKSKLSDPSQGGKSGEKKKKKKKSKPEHADALLVNLGGDAANGSQKNKSDAEYYYSYPAALLLTFDPAVPLPSQNEFISAFRKYGILLDSETELQKETNSARIVFAKSTDAERALNSADKTGVFAPPHVSYSLRYLPPIAGSPHHTPPLPLIRENLERMISTLATASGPLDEMKPDARENLVGDMESLLKKVNTIINGDAPGA